MHKILLIEDRIERQQLYSRKTGFDFNRYEDVLDNRITLSDIDLEDYNTIICHRSAFGEANGNVLDCLKDHCLKTKSQLVFFSGGISSTFYTKSNYEFLLLNSRAFYSSNLELYLDEVKFQESSNMRLLAYGENWKINMMLNTLSRVNMFISLNLEKEKVKAQRFKSFSQFENLNGIVEIEFPEIAFGGAVILDDIRLFADRLNEIVKREALLNG